MLSDLWADCTQGAPPTKESTYGELLHSVGLDFENDRARLPRGRYTEMSHTFEDLLVIMSSICTLCSEWRCPSALLTHGARVLAAFIIPVAEAAPAIHHLICRYLHKWDRRSDGWRRARITSFASYYEQYKEHMGANGGRLMVGPNGEHYTVPPQGASPCEKDFSAAGA